MPYDNEDYWDGGPFAEWRIRPQPMSSEALETRVREALYGAPADDGLETTAAITQTLHHVARHEAGHTLVAARLGMNVHSVAIDVDLGGETRFTPADSPTDVAAVAVAGALAERAHFGDTFGGEDDQAKLGDLLDRGADISQAIRTAQAIIDRHPRDLARIADQLVRRRGLDTADVTRLLGTADTPQSRSISDPTEIRTLRMRLIRDAFARRGEPWTVGAEHEAHLRLDDEKRGEIRDFAWQPTLR